MYFPISTYSRVSYAAVRSIFIFLSYCLVQINPIRNDNQPLPVLNNLKTCFLKKVMQFVFAMYRIHTTIIPSHDGSIGHESRPQSPPTRVESALENLTYTRFIVHTLCVTPYTKTYLYYRFVNKGKKTWIVTQKCQNQANENQTKIKELKRTSYPWIDTRHNILHSQQPWLLGKGNIK